MIIDSCASFATIRFAGVACPPVSLWPVTHSRTINMPDPIRKRFGYGQLRPLRPACSQNQAGSNMPNPTFRIKFGCVFPKNAEIMLCKTGQDPIWMAWSGFGKTHLVQKHAAGDVQESPGPVLAGRNRTVARFPLSDLVASVLPHHVSRM